MTGEELLDHAGKYVQAYWNQIAAISFSGYQLHGRGAVCIDLRLTTPTGELADPTPTYASRSSIESWNNDPGLSEALESYDPEQGAVVIMHGEGCYAWRTPHACPDELTPPEAHAAGFDAGGIRSPISAADIQ